MSNQVARLIHTALVAVLLALTLGLGSNIDPASAQTASNPILAVAWSPDGQRYAALDAQGSMEVVRKIDGEREFTFHQSTYLLVEASLAWNSAGTRLAAGIGHQVYIWDTSSWTVSSQFTAGDSDGEALIPDTGERVPEGVVSLNWSNDGRYLVAGSLSYFTTVWDTQTSGIIFQRIDLSGGGPGRVWLQDGWMSDGATRLNAYTLEYVSLSPSELRDSFGPGGGVVAFDPPPTLPYIGWSTVFGYVIVVDLQTLHDVVAIKVAERTANQPVRVLTDLSWNSTGEFVATVTRDGEILVVNVATQEVETVSTVLGQLFTVAWNPTTNEVIYGGVSDTGQPLLSVSNVDGIAGVPLSTPIPTATLTPTFTSTATSTETPTATPTPMATPPSSALVLGLGFEAGSGTTAVDSSTYQNDGTLLNGATWTTEGRFGNAIAFDGVDDRVSVADANSLDLTTGLTVEAWVKPTQVNDWSTIVMKELTSGESYVLYGWYYGTNTAAITSYDGYERIVQGGGLLPLNTWTHVAMTFDGAQQILYINGQVIASQTVIGTITTSDLPLSIGGNGLFSNEVFQGVIDEVRVYNVALSQTEIQQDMNLPVE